MALKIIKKEKNEYCRSGKALESIQHTTAIWGLTNSGRRYFSSYSHTISNLSAHMLKGQHKICKGDNSLQSATVKALCREQIFIKCNLPFPC